MSQTKRAYHDLKKKLKLLRELKDLLKDNEIRSILKELLFSGKYQMGPPGFEPGSPGPEPGSLPLAYGP